MLGMQKVRKNKIKFRKNNFTKEEKNLLVNSMHKDDTFFVKGKGYLGSEIRETEGKERIKICEAIQSYQIRKLKLQQELFKFNIESIPSELLAFLLDEKSLRYKMLPDPVMENPQAGVEQLIAKQQQLHSLLRMDILTKRLNNFFKAQKRIVMMEQMKDNALQWDEVKQSALRNEYKQLKGMVKGPLDNKQQIETEILELTKKIDITTKKTLKNTEEILTTVQSMDKTMKQGFAKVLKRIDKLEETLLSAIKSKKRNLLNDLILTETDENDVWRYGIAGMKAFDFTRDSDELDFWNWNEFQSPMISWNVFFRIVFYNTYRAISAMVINAFGGKAEFTAAQYFQEFGQAITIWISAVAKLVFSAVKNLSLAAVSFVTMDWSKTMVYAGKLVCSIVMAMAGELIVGVVAHGGLGSVMATFGKGLAYLVSGVQQYAFHSIISIGVSFLDAIWYSITGFTVVGGGSYDSLLYTQLRLGIDYIASSLYDLMPKYPGYEARISIRTLINVGGRALMDLLSSIYAMLMRFISTPKPIEAVQEALEVVAQNPKANVDKVIETATCASDEAIKSQLDTLKEYFTNQQSWGDWFNNKKIELPADLERYREWMNLSVEITPKWVMVTVTSDGKTLLMLQKHADMLYTCKEFKQLKF